MTPESKMAAVRAEVRRRWRDQGELWLTGPDWELIRADYPCDVCGVRVLDESYHLSYASEDRGGGARFEHVCRACYVAAGHAPLSPPRLPDDRALIWG